MDQPNDILSTYLRDGVVVIPSVLSPEEVALCRKGLHDDLLSVGVDYGNLAGSLEALKKIQTHQSGGMPFHYSPWRLRHCACNEKLFTNVQAIWKATWAANAKGFESPHAPFLSEGGFTLIDSLNFRLPSSYIEPVKSADKLQKNLAPHIDLNPWDKFGGKKGKTRWRPLQGFISLTDSTGGFECVKGSHLIIDELFSKVPRPPDYNIGFFGFQNQKVFRDVLSGMGPITCKPGDAIVWDWRLIHKTAEAHPGTDTREVVYTSFLPDIHLNRKYAKDQVKCLMKGHFPPDHANKKPKGADPNKEMLVPRWDRAFLNTLTEQEKQLLGFFVE